MTCVSTLAESRKAIRGIGHVGSIAAWSFKRAREETYWFEGVLFSYVRVPRTSRGRES